ncbi:hypothetical protein ACMFMG_005735 [Clarireedia jacksonii]
MSLPPGADLNLIPAGQPPPGVIPNFVNPPSLLPAQAGVWGTLIFITVICVACRCYSSFQSSSKLAADDWTAIIATIFALCHSAIILSFGRTARHQWDIPVAWLLGTYIKKSFALQFFASLAVFTAKASLLLLYRAIFSVKKWMNYAVYAGIVWDALANLPYIPLAIYFCAPHNSEHWDFTVSKRCGKPIKWDITTGVMILVLDLYILVLPLPILMKLQLSHRKRLGLLAVFLTAGLAIVCASLSVTYYIAVMKATTDASWPSAQIYLVRGVENYISILVGCAPGLASFFNTNIAGSKIYNSLASTFRSHSTKSSDPSKTSDVEGNGGYYGLRTFGGTPYNKATKNINPQSDSTSQLQHTEVTYEPRRGNNSGEDGIHRSVGFDQRSTHSAV